MTTINKYKLFLLPLPVITILSAIILPGLVDFTNATVYCITWLFLYLALLINSNNNAFVKFINILIYINLIYTTIYTFTMYLFSGPAIVSFLDSIYRALLNSSFFILVISVVVRLVLYFASRKTKKLR